MSTSPDRQIETPNDSLVEHASAERVFALKALDFNIAAGVAATQAAFDKNIGRTGLGNPFTARMAQGPNDANPVIIKDPMAVERVTQTGNFAPLRNPETPKQDQYNAALTEIGQKNKVTPATPGIDTDLARMLVHQSFTDTNPNVSQNNDLG
jgi:hypothetical protein